MGELVSLTEKVPSDATHAFLTIIFPCVKVPVLSEQMFVTAPRASRESSFRTMTFLETMIFVPTAIVIVKTTTKLAGIIDNPVLLKSAVFSKREFHNAYPTA